MDPTHKTSLTEILQRSTSLPVQQVKDRTKVEQDSVYIIPPNKDLAVRGGVLHLSAPKGTRGLRLPIDSFLCSLAEDQHHLGSAVILSGMGEDGRQGVLAIKEKGGLVFAQDPASAKFDSMPRAAIATGLVDVIAPADQIAARLVDRLGRSPQVAASSDLQAKSTGGALDKLLLLVRLHTGSDFSLYKRNSVQRRVAKRMAVHRINSISTYLQFLRKNPSEIDLLFREMLIGVTSFFRDPEVWEELKHLEIPTLLAGRIPVAPIRVWVPGCSTGEEAYSLGILLAEAQGEAKPESRAQIQIFATDLDRNAVEKARQGLYPSGIEAHVSAARLARFFVKEPNGYYRVKQELRDLIVFATHNLIHDPPFTKLDVLSCRNLLIYLTSTLQNKLIPLFHYSLRPGGILLLGSAESVGAATFLFGVMNRGSKIFLRKGVSGPQEAIEFPPAFVPHPPDTPAFPAKTLPTIKDLANEALLLAYTPPAVLVNGSGDILYVSGHTGRFLEPSTGKANWNVFAMAREGLRSRLVGVFQKALRGKSPAAVRNLLVEGDADPSSVDVIVHPVQMPGDRQSMALIVFANAVAISVKQKKQQLGTAGSNSRRMVEQYHQMAADLIAARDQMQTSQEELRSANEELQSTNEELQSTNEELTTSKEELQSLNEELQTVNSELQSKVDELVASNSDMTNLMNSTNIATVFLG